MCCFGLVRFASVWFGGVWRPKKGAKNKNVRGARRLRLLLKRHYLLVWRGLAWFGAVRRGSAAEKGHKKMRVVFFLWFGLVRRGSQKPGDVTSATSGLGVIPERLHRRRRPCEQRLIACA